MPRSSTFRRRCGTNRPRIGNRFAIAPVVSAGALAFDESGAAGLPFNSNRPKAHVQPEANLNSWKFSFHKLSIAKLLFPPMMPVQNYSLRRAGRFALVAIVFGFWFGGEQTCQASCGDYLQHHGDQSYSLLSTDGSGTSHHMPTTPCRGANCSRRSETPPLPTRPTVETVSSLEWLCVIEQIRGQDDESHRRSLESAPLMARHTSQLLDRPPRG